MELLAQAADGAAQAAQQGLDPAWVTNLVTGIITALIGALGGWFYKAKSSGGGKPVNVKGDVRVSRDPGAAFMSPEDCRASNAGFEGRLEAVETELRDFRAEILEAMEKERSASKQDQNNVYTRINAISVATARVEGLVGSMNNTLQMLLNRATGGRHG
jgi:hypothetical protein